MNKFSVQDIPATPGVYVFRNSTGEIIYVGKAKSLRKRLASYFRPSGAQKADVKLRALIHSIADFETFTVNTEAEALLLESRLIKQYSPRYNVELRDDKRFLHICVDPSEPFPRLRLTRTRKEDGRLYFGPYPRASVLRSNVKYLSKRFGLRTCGPRRPDRSTRAHCLEHVFRACCCPCIGEVGVEEYAQRLDQAIDVLRGDTERVVTELTREMTRLAEGRRFEEAARIRDMIENLRFVFEGGRRTFLRARIPSGHKGGEPVEALRQAVGLKSAPFLIECFDISSIGGKMAVGSLVCFRDGKPWTRQYRRYRIRSPEARDDSAMVREVVYRRYARAVEEGREMPDLVVIDGGCVQLAAAMSALYEAKAPPVPVLGLAKRQEEVYLPGRRLPLSLPRHHPGLKLLQAVRDEAHRFALTFHRSLRRRRIADSLLAEVEGVGPKRQQLLLQRFGSARRLRQATPEEVCAEVPGIGLGLARRIHAFLNNRSPRPS